MRTPRARTETQGKELVHGTLVDRMIERRPRGRILFVQRKVEIIFGFVEDNISRYVVVGVYFLEELDVQAVCRLKVTTHELQKACTSIETASSAVEYFLVCDRAVPDIDSDLLCDV